MEIRNATYAADGVGINCEIDHPRFGWIPFTARPDDPDEGGGNVYAAIDPASVASYTPSPKPTQAEIDAQQQDDIDAALAELDRSRSAFKALAQGLLLVANDVRELQGKQPITPQQYRNWLKARM